MKTKFFLAVGTALSWGALLFSGCGGGSDGGTTAAGPAISSTPSAITSTDGAAKAAQIHLIRELARAWAPVHVRVCGVAPGPVLMPEGVKGDSEETVLGRLGDPADVAVTSGVTHGVQAIALSIAWRPGDRIVLFDGDYPQEYVVVGRFFPLQ